MPGRDGIRGAVPPAGAGERNGWCPSCYGAGRELRGFGEDETGEEAHWSQGGDDDPERECRACAGRRLRPEALVVRYRSRSIADFGALDVGTARGVLIVGGRCAACEGQGVQRVEMSFLPDVRVPCDACGGRRFTAETLDIRYLDMSIAEVLNASVDEALPRFEAHPRIHRALHRLVDAGNTVVVIEHNLDVIAEADTVIDLGPEGGAGGGRVVAAGPPEEIAGARGSHTGEALARFLDGRR